MRSFLFLAIAVLALACTSKAPVLLNGDGDSETDTLDTELIEADRDSERDADTLDQAEAEPERDAAETDAEPEADAHTDCATSPYNEVNSCAYEVRPGLVLNPGCAPCPQGTVCKGNYYDGLYQGTLEDDQGLAGMAISCQTDFDCPAWLNVCVGGYCGISYCTIEGPCTKQEDCAAIGKGAWCQIPCRATQGRCRPDDGAIPEPGCFGQPGGPCAFTDGLNEMGGACQDSTMCLGMLYNKPGQALTCTSKADCVAHGLDSTLCDCSKSGYCGISFCSADAGEACTATKEQPGQSAVCEALPGMNTPRYGKACCQVVSGKNFCIPDSLCTQEGTATAGQACKDPSFEVNTSRDFCGADLFCASHIFENQSCTSKSECVGIDAEHADCVGGHCALSFCTRPDCQTNADCPAESYGSGSCCTTTLYAGDTALCAPAILCGP